MLVSGFWDSDGFEDTERVLTLLELRAGIAMCMGPPVLVPYRFGRRYLRVCGVVSTVFVTVIGPVEDVRGLCFFFSSSQQQPRVILRMRACV